VTDSLFKHGETVAVFNVYTKGKTAPPVPLEIVQENGETSMELLVYIVDKAAAIQQLRETPQSFKFPGTYIKMAYYKDPIFIPTSDNATDAQKAYTVYMVQDPHKGENASGIGKKIKLGTDEPPIMEMEMEMVPYTELDPANQSIIRAKRQGKGGASKGKGKGKGRDSYETPPPRQRPTSPTGSKRGAAEAQEAGAASAETGPKKQRTAALDAELSALGTNIIGELTMAEMSAQAAQAIQAAREDTSGLTPVTGTTDSQREGRKLQMARRRSVAPENMEEDADGAA
jgi:hypothetical protein